DLIDAHDEVSMYWGWAFAWDGAQTKLAKGHARIYLEIRNTAQARRHVDCLVATNNLSYVPDGRRKPDFSAMRYLRDWTNTRMLTPLFDKHEPPVTSPVWQRPKIAGRDFLMPWNIANEFWPLSKKPAAERPLY